MSIFFDNDHDDLLNSIVNKDINPGHVYETIYDVVIKNKDWVLYGDHSKESKLKVMGKLIEWFEKTEEFEKCQKLKKIKDEL
jgi:hypothetical protein